MEELNTKLNKELSDIQIAILSNLPHKVDTFTDQEICDKLKEIDKTKDINATIIEKELNDLEKQGYISSVLNTSLEHNYKIYKIRELAKEYMEQHTKSNNNQNELKNE